MTVTPGTRTLISARKLYDEDGMWRAEYVWLDEYGKRHEIGMERPTKEDLERAEASLKEAYPNGLPV